MLTTLSLPDSGRGLIDGFDVVKNPMDIKMRIGVVPQENNVDRDLTAYENLFIYAKLHRVENLREEIAAMLRAVDLWERKDSVVSNFSGGMQRRLLSSAGPSPQTSGFIPG